MHGGALGGCDIVSLLELQSITCESYAYMKRSGGHALENVIHALYLLGV